MSKVAEYGGRVTGPSGAALAATLDDVAHACASNGAVLTSGRRRVLELLTAAGRPLKAYDLIAAYPVAGKATNPITIYRALDFLMERGLVQKIVSLNAYLALRVGQSPPPAVTLVCQRCGTVERVAEDAVAEINDRSTDRGFSMKVLTLEGQGFCRECSGAAT